MKIYNKLVRDKIPQIIQSNGQSCKTRVLDNKEYLEQLNIKLKEETNEYLESGEVEELADIEEVLRAILQVKGCDYTSFDKLRQSKVDKRGAFEDKIFLESTED